MTTPGTNDRNDANVRPAPYLCRPFLTALPISGASVTIISAAGGQSTLCTSDPVAARLDELQFELGEGPQWLASRSGKSVLIPDINVDEHHEWPVFASAVRELRVAALFSIPINMGAVTLGAATLYRDKPGELNTDQQTSALAIASAIASTAVQHAISSAGDDAPDESVEMPALRREVHQATGMILVQLDTTATIAFSRLQAHAFATGQTVQSVAHDVVIRKLVFDDQTP
jgi:GAF domain-containing protein